MKEYFVDLATLVIKAKDEDKAYAKAFRLIKNGKIEIEIVGVEEAYESLF